MPTVLVVDDDPFSLDMMPRILDSSRYRVVTARSGGEAIGLVGQVGESIKLMLLDVSLPDMDGFALADRARAVVPAARVIYVSGHPAKDGLRSCWIQKPIDVPALQRRVMEELVGP